MLVVLLYSIYANVCTHWGAYEAARAKELQQDEPASTEGQGQQGEDEQKAEPERAPDHDDISWVAP